MDDMTDMQFVTGQTSAQYEQAGYRLALRGVHPLFLSQVDQHHCQPGSQFSDVTLVLRDGSYRLNSCLLAVISPYFRLIGQDENSVVVIPDLCSQSLQSLVRFIFQNHLFNSAIEDESLQDAVTVLGCKLFTSTSEYSVYLNNLANLKSQHQHHQQQHQHQHQHAGQQIPVNNLSHTRDSNAVLVENSELSNANQGQNNALEVVQVPEQNMDTGDRRRGRGRGGQQEVQEEVGRGRGRGGRRGGQETLKGEVEMEEMELGHITDIETEKTEQEYYYNYQYPNQLMCHSCSETGFSSVGAVVDHLRTVHCWTHSVDHCAFCDVPFMARLACVKHEKKECKNTSYSCYFASCGGATLGSRRALLGHLLREHGRGIRRKCPHCHVTYLTLSTLEARTSQWRHPQVCEKRKEAVLNNKPKKKGAKKTCPDCGSVHTDTWKHRRQCVAINNDIKFTCFCCNKGFRRLGSIGKHFSGSKKCRSNPRNQSDYQGVLKSVENPVKGFTTCADCGLSYSIKKGRQTHARNCSAFTRFKCHSCNKGMNALDGFHIHFSKFPGCRAAKENKDIVAELNARSVKPDFYVCHLCGAQYKTKETFDKHTLTHQENVNYLFCHEPDCGKQFLTAKSLDVHLKNHTMPMVICSICGKQVKQGSLGLHMVLHTGKKVTCPLCGKLFQHRGVLNKHFTACHTDKKRRKKKSDVEMKSLSDQFLEPIMHTIQVDLATAEAVSHQQQQQQQQSLEGEQQTVHHHQVLHQAGLQDAGGHHGGGQAQLVVPQPPASIYGAKDDGIKMEESNAEQHQDIMRSRQDDAIKMEESNSDQHQDIMRSRQILVNSAGQIVVDTPPGQTVMLAPSQEHLAVSSSNLIVLTQPSYQRVVVNSILDVNSIMHNQDQSGAPSQAPQYHTAAVSAGGDGVQQLQLQDAADNMQ